MTVREKIYSVAAMALGLFFIVGGLAFAQMKMDMPEGRAMVMSKHPYNDTVSKLKQAIADQEMMVLFTADHQEMLKMVGLDTKPMLTIEFFHPRYGKKIYENDGRAAIEIPLRLVLMENQEGMVMVSYNKPSYVFSKYPKLKDLGTELDGVYDKIVASVTK